MTLKEYLDNRTSATYGRKLRILDTATKKNCGSCVSNFNALVVNIKQTEKYLFIFVKKY